MKRTPIILFIAGVLLAGLGLSAQETATPRREAQVERRAARQQARIAQGEASGALTPREVRRLERREARLDGHLARAGADGRITRGEQARLNREADRDSRAIYRNKHNARVQP